MRGSRGAEAGITAALTPIHPSAGYREAQTSMSFGGVALPPKLTLRSLSAVFRNDLTIDCLNLSLGDGDQRLLVPTGHA